MSSIPSPISDPYGYLGISLNPDGTITRDPTRFPCTAATPDPTPENPVVSKDIPINDSKSTWLRLYLPPSAIAGVKKLPLVVYFHGGGFVLCSVDFAPFHVFCSNMARELNAVVASVSYRLAPEHRLPAAYEDAVEALHWIRSSNDEWLKNHTDLSNTFVVGTSAGGNMAYAVGLRAAAATVSGDLEPLRIRGVVLHHPFFGGVERSSSEIRLEKDTVLPPKLCDIFWELSLPVGVDQDHEYSNPTVEKGQYGLEEIGRLGWKVMVIGSEGDPLIDRQRQVVELMKKKSVDVLGHFTDGEYHGVEIMDPSKAKPMYDVMRNFISDAIV